MRAVYGQFVQALKAYESDPDALAFQTVMNLQQYMREAFLAYLEEEGYTVTDERDNYPKLVDMVWDHTTLLGGDQGLVRLLVSLNSTRNELAHGNISGLTPSQIRNDAARLAGLVRRFWPAWYGETCPVPPGAPAGPRPPRPEPQPQPQPAKHESRWGRLLRQLWRDEQSPSLRRGLLLKRLLGIVLYLVLSRFALDAALRSARWPPPVKYASVGVFLLAVALFAWSLVVLWRVLCQIRLKGLLIAAGLVYGLVIVASLLTTSRPLTSPREAWLATRWVWEETGRVLVDTGQAVIGAPEAFRFAYTGQRQPTSIARLRMTDGTDLPPVLANPQGRAAIISQKPTASPGSIGGSRPASPGSTAGDTAPVTGTAGAESESALQPPDCPYPAAHLTAPRVGQVIDEQVKVEGTANIEALAYYKFEFMQLDIADEWHWAASYEVPVQDGVLGVWETAHLPEGQYAFRLTVINVGGNYPYPPCEARVEIRH